MRLHRADAPVQTLYGLTLQGVDDAGCRWTTTEEEGWFAPAGIRRTRRDRSQQNGAWPSTSNLEAKTVTLRGVINAPTHLTLLDAIDSIKALAEVREGPITWADPRRIYTGTAELDDRILLRVEGDRIATWQITLTIPDSVVYGPEYIATAGLGTVDTIGYGWTWPRAYATDWHPAPASVAGDNVIQLSNAGTSTWWPRIRVATTASNPRITMLDTGAFIQIDGIPPVGVPIDIDCAARTVYAGRTSWRHRVSWRGDWLAVPPGTSPQLVFTASSTDPTATLTVWAREGAWA